MRYYELITELSDAALRAMRRMGLDPGPEGKLARENYARITGHPWTPPGANDNDRAKPPSASQQRPEDNDDSDPFDFSQEDHDAFWRAERERNDWWHHPDTPNKILQSENAEQAFEYARDVLRKRWPEAEPFISKYADVASWYAQKIIKGAWPQGSVAEKVIAKNAECAVYYALYVLKAPFPAGEPAIAKKAEHACNYARWVLKAPFPAGEPAIAKKAEWAFFYARDAVKGPWPAGEPVLSQSGWSSFYAREVLHHPDPNAWGPDYRTKHNIKSPYGSNPSKPWEKRKKSAKKSVKKSPKSGPQIQ